MEFEKFKVWRDGQMIGAGFVTLDEAKAFAKRNASYNKLLFEIGITGPEYQATFSMNSRAKWEVAAAMQQARRGDKT